MTGLFVKREAILAGRALRRASCTLLRAQLKTSKMHLVVIGILALLVLLIVTVFILLVYSGLFDNFEVGAGQPPIEEAIVAYKFARGQYKQAGALFTEVTAIGPKCKCLGIYYDDPEKKKPHRLRYAVGAVLAEGTQEVDPDLKKKFLDEGFKIIHLPKATNAVRGSFPFISTLSIFIAISKAYPALKDYIQEHKLCAHPFLEVYEGSTIHFMVPLSQQDGFYVPETRSRPRAHSEFGDDVSDVSDTDGNISEDDTPAPSTSRGDDGENLTPSASPRGTPSMDSFSDSLLDDIMHDSILEISSSGISMTSAHTEAAVPSSATPKDEQVSSTTPAVPAAAAMPPIPEITVQDDLLSSGDPAARKEDKSETESQGSSGSSFEEIKMENEELPPS